MATFQTPKTDWSVEDGVLNTDFNRIEGNIAFLKENAANQLRSAVTYYISASGSDTNDGSSITTPFATISHALSIIPKDLGGLAVTLVVASGTYDGFTMEGYTNGTINIVGSTSGADLYISSNVTIRNCHSVQLTSFGSFIVYGTFNISNVTGLLNSVDTTVSNSANNAVVVMQSNAAFTASLTVTSSAITSGLVVDYNSDVFVESMLTMPGTGTGIKVDRGGKFTYSNLSNRATAGTLTTRGGRIYTGSIGSGGLS